MMQTIHRLCCDALGLYVIGLVGWRIAAPLYRRRKDAKDTASRLDRMQKFAGGRDDWIEDFNSDTPDNQNYRMKYMINWRPEEVRDRP